jgi:hypothetical protein
MIAFANVAPLVNVADLYMVAYRASLTLPGTGTLTIGMPLTPTLDIRAYPRGNAPKAPHATS